MKYLLLVFMILFSTSAFAGGDPNTDYEFVAASQTDQACGPTGGSGDILERLIIFPATTGAGDVSIEDGTLTNRTVLVSGTLSDLSPIVVELGMRSRDGAWEVTTGANVSAMCVGKFK